MKKLLLSIFSLVVFSFVATAGDDLLLYERCSYVGQNGDTLLYRLLKPEIIKADTEYPLVVFMHGAGERGNDNEKQLIHGAQVWLNPVNRETYPCYVLLPQCPEGKYWAYDSRPESFEPELMPVQTTPTPIIQEVMELIEKITDENNVDSDRIYVMGLSMGGMATFDMACRYPDVFAAAVPICGTVNPARLATAAEVPFRIYHGDKDTTVPVSGSRAAYRQLKKLGADVTLKEFPGVGHGSWYPAFTDPEFLPWLFSKSNY